MILSAEARASRKEAQLARLARKRDKDYPALYASQPEQQEKAAVQGAQRRLERSLKNAADTNARANAQSSTSVFTSGLQTAAPGSKKGGGE